MANDDLQTKMLHAGIVPQEAVAQMEQWQTMPEGSAAKVGEADLGKVKALQEDLELQRLPTLRETILDLGKIMDKARPVDLKHGELTCRGAMAGVDRLGRYIFLIPTANRRDYNLISTLLRPMTVLTDMSLQPPRDRRTITSVSVLYNTVEQGKKKLSAPTHWFCETEAAGEETIIRGR